ncbi:hypothetical protein ABE493_13930 [Stenotrophomonas terrae]|uniref:hypothetical protein n=1 Tax=Stenotrophomonas terrae TaxID=405446 RepID=UPI00320B04C0
MSVLSPRTYADWSIALERFAQGNDDDAVLLSMAQGQLDWTPGVATLFSERIHAVLDLRVQALSVRLDRSFSYSRDEVEVVRALLDARRHLGLLHRLACVPALPDVLRKHLLELLEKVAQRMQQSLEDSARRQNAEALLRTLRHHDLRHFHSSTMVAPAATGASASDATPLPTPSRRRSFLV